MKDSKEQTNMNEEPLRSREDWLEERAFLEKHAQAEIVYDASGPSRAVYWNPVRAYYKEGHTGSYSDMKKRVDAMIERGPEDPAAKENLKKVLDGTI